MDVIVLSPAVVSTIGVRSFSSANCGYTTAFPVSSTLYKPTVTLYPLGIVHPFSCLSVMSMAPLAVLDEFAFIWNVTLSLKRRSAFAVPTNKAALCMSETLLTVVPVGTA